jgi:type IV pilus assembly protein PilB
MATQAAVRNISGLARAMVQQGLLSEFDADALQTQAKASNLGFVEQVLVSKRMTASQVAVFASRAFHAPLFDLTGFDLDQVNKELIDPKMIATRRILPLQKRGNRLFVAVSDPANLQALDEIRFKTNLVPDAVVVEDDKLAQTIAKVVESMARR